MHVPDDTARLYAVSDIDADQFVPFIEEGQELGMVHWLCNEDVSRGGIAAGIWLAEPGTSACNFDYHFTANETFHVLEGSVHIELSDGQFVDIGPGGIAAFRKGTTSHWRVQAPFRKFFVLS